MEFETPAQAGCWTDLLAVAPTARLHVTVRRASGRTAAAAVTALVASVMGTPRLTTANWPLVAAFLAARPGLSIELISAAALDAALKQPAAECNELIDRHQMVVRAIPPRALPDEAVV